ncbi:hypothetical protein AVEN_237230-1 [Araneus ventricosus]|uniref:Uncharacterized protein n=1 Tax=Araneus ventricosus TaxID=182803 RepID=A0A4Y2P2B0_ARAVE|nr:hypothetical protein AVEN_237230-1 [Araneus ventricosus]
MPPKINIQASDYFEIINWNSCVACPPPMLRDLREDDIKSLINSDTTPSEKYKSFPVTPRTFNWFSRRNGIRNGDMGRRSVTPRQWRGALNL